MGTRRSICSLCADFTTIPAVPFVATFPLPRPDTESRCAQEARGPWAYWAVRAGAVLALAGTPRNKVLLPHLRIPFWCPARSVYLVVRLLWER